MMLHRLAERTAPVGLAALGLAWRGIASKHFQWTVPTNPRKSRPIRTYPDKSRHVPTNAGKSRQQHQKAKWLEMFEHVVPSGWGGPSDAAEEHRGAQRGAGGGLPPRAASAVRRQYRGPRAPGRRGPSRKVSLSSSWFSRRLWRTIQNCS